MFHRFEDFTIIDEALSFVDNDLSFLLYSVQPLPLPVWSLSRICVLLSVCPSGFDQGHRVVFGLQLSIAGCCVHPWSHN